MSHMSRIWMSHMSNCQTHVSWIKEQNVCHTDSWVWFICVTESCFTGNPTINESYDIHHHERIMFHKRLSHVTHMNESCRTHEWVMSRKRMSDRNTAYCIGRVNFSFSNLNRQSSSLGLFCHIPLKRDQWDWDWRLRMNDTPIAIYCTLFACTAFSDESCHTHEWVMSHTWMIISHIWMSHVTHKN